MRQATKPLVKVILRTTRRPHRENWRSVRLAKALYLSLGYASIRAQYLFESEEMPNVSDDTLMDTGVEVVLELVAYMVGGYFLYLEYRKSIEKESANALAAESRKVAAKELEQRMDALESLVRAHENELKDLREKSGGGP